MKKQYLLMSILIGFLAGQVFAEGGRPFSVINTLRFGYDDNVYRSSNKTSSAYIQDIVDLAFRAALSDRTDLIVKSQFRFRSDKENKLNPNVYAVLSHSFSQRLLLQVSEKFVSGDSTTGTATRRKDYSQNTLGVTPTYVLTPKDRLALSMIYSVRKHEKSIEEQDYSSYNVGVSWNREFSPQRTRGSLSLSQTMVEYDNRNSGYDSTLLTAELGHTFNPEWHGTVAVGGTLVQPDFAPPAKNENSLVPYFKAGLSYTPTPRTRLSTDFSHSYQESANSLYGGQTSQSLRFGLQHDLTAKIMAKASVRFSESTYDTSDRDGPTATSGYTEERFDVDFRLSYKLNRINFLELGIKHTEKEYSNASARNWDQNMIDFGWRVEL